MGRRKASLKPGKSAVTLDWAENEKATDPSLLEKDGQPIAVVVKYDEYLRLENVRRYPLSWHDHYSHRGRVSYGIRRPRLRQTRPARLTVNQGIA